MLKMNEESLINSLDISNGDDVAFLLGAGCSILSGCMPSSKLVYEFKKRLYCIKNGVRLGENDFIDDFRLKDLIEQEFINSNVENEYSFYFEKCFPDANDRNLFIKSNFKDKKPSFGYLCFADYLINKGVKTVLTTNFDLLIERAVRKIDENYDLINVSENEVPLLNGELHIIKLHGDYNYDSIKNTETELKEIPKKLFDKLINLEVKKIIVLGYSGQDLSVMNFLSEYIVRHPNTSIYWCGLENACSNEKIIELLKHNSSYYVTISGFDSLFENMYKFRGSNNKYLNDLYSENVNTKHFELKSINQLEHFKLNTFKLNSNVIVYKTTENIDEALLNNFYYHLKYREHTYIISSKYLIDKISKIKRIDTCVLDNENIPIDKKCKLIKELIKWHSYDKGILIYKDNLYIDNGELIKEGLKINVDLFNGSICLILNPNYFIPSMEISENDRFKINKKKSELYTKQNWDMLNKQIELIFNNNFVFGDSNILVSFNNCETSENEIEKNYSCSKEPSMSVEKMQSVNQIKLLDSVGPKKTMFSIDEINVGIICCEEDKDVLRKFLYEVQNGIYGFGTEIIPQYQGFDKIFNKKINFNFDVVPKFTNIQLKNKMDKKGIYGIVDSYLNALNIAYQKQIDMVLIYVGNNLSWLRNNEEVDFHNIIKLKAANKFKTQFLEEKTIISKDNKSKILFNFAIGIYTKTVGMPWYPTNYSKDTLFLGLSFGRDSNGINVGCSQMFDAAGRGMQLIISQISDKKRKNQYLSESEAYELGIKIRQTYYKSSKIEDLKRIVIHRNNPFRKEEISGFKKAFEGIEDFVLLQVVEDTAVNIYPFGKYGCNGYPAKRGTILKASNDTAYIWTDGSVVDAEINNGKPYRNSKRGMGRPLKIKKFYGNVSIDEVANDLMYLTKMDFNSSDVLYSKLPVTLKYSRVVCDLIKQGNFEDDLISFEYVM